MEKDWVVLNIDKHHMWVSLTLKVPEGDENISFTSEFIHAYLKENGISSGINDAAINALVESVAYGQEVIVARGKEAINGRDGFYQYLIALEDAKSKPAVNSDGTVDYYNSLKLAMVEENELFAIYIPPTSGEYGYTVFSEMLPPVKGKPAPRLKGKGFTVSEDGREYRASFAGRIYMNNDRVIVDKIYVIKGDLDIEHGNIKFNGDVEVTGDVRSGLKIDADGNIFVHGHVGSCQLNSGGNITIRKGVQGRDKCIITAKGDIAISFVERCTLSAEGNIYADSLLDCNVSSKQQIFVTAKKGVIVGGKVFAMHGIVAKNAGNEHDVATILQAGVIPEHIRQANEIANQVKKYTSDMELLDKNLKVSDAIEGCKRTKQTEAIRMKIIRAKVVVNTELKKLEDHLNYLNEQIERAKSEATVVITGTVYPGVRVSMGQELYIVQDACKDVIFKCKNHQITMEAGNN